MERLVHESAFANATNLHDQGSRVSKFKYCHSGGKLIVKVKGIYLNNMGCFSLDQVGFVPLTFKSFSNDHFLLQGIDLFNPSEYRKVCDSLIIEQLNTPVVDSFHQMATKVYVVYYSMYGHVEKLAREIKKGAASVEGVEAKLWQVPETFDDEVLWKMSAPPKSDAPIITPTELAEADGFVFGFPTRFGMMSAQFKAFFDATGSLWRTQKLAGKPAGIFNSTGAQCSGEETTPLTAITQLAHHGMIFVPIGYTFGADMFEMGKAKGGSPYGAGTYAGDGSRQPSELELEQAFHQGKHIATVTKKLKGSP